VVVNKVQMNTKRSWYRSHINYALTYLSMAAQPLGTLAAFSMS
jgi:hypothetical protein